MKGTRVTNRHDPKSYNKQMGPQASTTVIRVEGEIN